MILKGLIMRLMSLLPIENKAVFVSYGGECCNCNPLALYKELLVKLPNYKFVWLMKDNSIKIEGADVVGVRSFKAIYHLATARLWIDNGRKASWTVKREGQYYVQTSHCGILILKKCEADVEDKLPKRYVKNAKHDSKCADIVLSGSKWRTENIRHSDWYDGKILEYGLPRSDIFYRDKTEIRKRVLSFFGLPNRVHIVLYAPTFRNNHSMAWFLPQEECGKVLNALQERFGGEWRIIVKLHPNMAYRQDLIRYNEMVINGSIYNEINELIIASDMLITDYSSNMFDAMEAKKKVMIYATDILAYEEERGFHFSFDELPFPSATNMQDFIACIKDFDTDSYEEKTSDFMKQIQIYDDGHSSERVSDYIVDQIRKLDKDGKP